MKIRNSRGMTSIRPLSDKWAIQLYYPEIYLSKTYGIRASSGFIFNKLDKGFQFGFQILGFGLGVGKYE